VFSRKVSSSSLSIIHTGRHKKKWDNGRMEALDGFWLAVINSCGDGQVAAFYADTTFGAPLAVSGLRLDLQFAASLTLKQGQPSSAILCRTGLLLFLGGFVGL
jgi:hypothetical protein